MATLETRVAYQNDTKKYSQVIENSYNHLKNEIYNHHIKRGENYLKLEYRGFTDKISATITAQRLADDLGIALAKVRESVLSYHFIFIVPKGVDLSSMDVPEWIKK